MRNLISRVTDPEKREQGFTLIELLVVIIIIGILAAIAIPIFLNQKQKATEATVKSDVRNAVSVVESASTEGNTTFDQAGVAALPKITISAGNHLRVGGDSSGYCIEGWNPDTTAKGSTYAYWYDSSTGKTSGPGAPVAGGVCDQMVNQTNTMYDVG